MPTYGETPSTLHVFWASNGSSIATQQSPVVPTGFERINKLYDSTSTNVVPTPDFSNFERIYNCSTVYPRSYPHYEYSISLFLVSSHPTPLHTSKHVSASTPPPRYDIFATYAYELGSWPQTAVRLLHPKSRWARSILRRRGFVRPPRSRQIHVLLVWRGVGCGGWRDLPVRRHP